MRGISRRHPPSHSAGARLATTVPNSAHRMAHRPFRNELPSPVSTAHREGGRPGSGRLQHHAEHSSSPDNHPAAWNPQRESKPLWMPGSRKPHRSRPRPTATSTPGKRDALLVDASPLSSVAPLPSWSPLLPKPDAARTSACSSRHVPHRCTGAVPHSHRPSTPQPGGETSLIPCLPEGGPVRPYYRSASKSKALDMTLTFSVRRSTQAISNLRSAASDPWCLSRNDVATR